LASKYNFFKLNIFIIYFLIISYTKILGIYKNDGGIGIGQLNVLGIAQIISIVLLLLGIFLNIFKVQIFNSKIKRIFIVFFFIVIVSIVLGIVKTILDGLALSSFIQNVSILYIYGILIILSATFKLKEDILMIFEIINNLAVIASIVTIYQVLFIPSEINVGLTIYDQFRYFSTTGLLVAFSFFIEYTKLLQSGTITLKGILILSLTAIAVLIQMHRSVLLGFAIVNFIPIVMTKKIKAPLIKIVIISTGIVIIGGIVLSITSFSLNKINFMFTNSISDLETGDGSFLFRLGVFINTFMDVIKNYPILGRGFIWQKLDLNSYYTTLTAYSPTTDNSYTNVLLCFGLTGFIVFLALIFVSIKNLIILYKSEAELIILPILLAQIYVFLNSFFTDNFFGMPSTIVTIIIFYVTYLILTPRFSINYAKSRSFT